MHSRVTNAAHRDLSLSLLKNLVTNLTNLVINLKDTCHTNSLLRNFLLLTARHNAPLLFVPDLRQQNR